MKIWRLFLTQTFAGLALLSVPTQTSADISPKWEPAGWGGGGWFWAAAYHPAKDGVIYLGLDVGGVAKTLDHGLTWKITNSGLTNYGVYSLAVDRSNPETVYAVTEGGLHRSTDGGQQWNLLPKTGPKDLRITAERAKSVRALAVDPTNGKNLYAASPGGKVYRSTDGGETWTVAVEKKGPIYAVAVAAQNPALVVAATEESGLLLSEDSGVTWRELETPKKASSATFSQTDPNLMFASFFKDGVWKSADRGKTWSRILEVADSSIREVAVSPVNPLELYAIGSSVYISKDGGKSWKESRTLQADLEGNPTRHYNGTSPTTDIVHPMNVVVSPHNPQEVFISADWRSAWSGDGGLTWHERERGADISCITDIRFSKGRVYTTAMDEGTLVSEDNGKNWRQLWPLKYIPETSGHYWRVAVNTVNGVDRIVSTASPWNTKPRRVVVSEDGGKTFKDTTSGLPDYLVKPNTMWGEGHPRALAVDPKDPKIMYLGLDGNPEEGKLGGGIFKSEDGGANWKQLANQPASRRMYYGLVIDPTDSKRLFWGACGDGGGVYRSEDGGESWSNVFKNDTWIFNLLVAQDGKVYAAGKNLWQSSDYGATWKQITQFTEGRSVCGLEVDPRNPKTIWISQLNWDGSSNGAVHKTTDGGETWQDITGNLSYVKPQILRFNPETNELWAGFVGLHKIRQ